MNGLRNQPWYPLLPLVPIHILATSAISQTASSTPLPPSSALDSTFFMWGCVFTCCSVFGKTLSG